MKINKLMPCFPVKPKENSIIFNSDENDKWRIAIALHPNQKWQCCIRRKSQTPLGIHKINYDVSRGNVSLHLNREEFRKYFEKIKRKED